MDGIIDGLTTLVSLVSDAGRCIRQPFSTAACDFFWPGVILVVIGVCLVGLFLVAKTLVRDLLAHRRAAARWRADQEVAAPEVMEQSKWRGEAAAAAELSQAELAARIKEQLARQRQKTDEKGASGA
jgi:hypothetical protein